MLNTVLLLVAVHAASASTTAQLLLDELESYVMRAGHTRLEEGAGLSCEGGHVAWPHRAR